MNKLPKVSVIIANHNYGEYVVEAIESALAQDYSGELSVVVVDDASTDKSVENIHTFLGKNHDSGTIDATGKNLKVESNIKNRKVTLIGLKDNVKQGEARNIAIREAWNYADYFAILDSDDVMLPSKISKCVAKATEYPEEIGSVHTDYFIEDVDNNVTTLEFKPPFTHQALLAGDCHLHSGGVISRYALEKVGLFDKDVPPKEDYLMWLKIAHYFTCVHIAEPLVRVRVTNKNSTITHTNEQHIAQYQLMWNKFENWLKGQSNA